MPTRRSLLASVCVLAACTGAPGPVAGPPASAPVGISLPKVEPGKAALDPVVQSAVKPSTDLGPLVDAIWEAAEKLPPEKQARLKPAFMDVLSAHNDTALKETWEKKLGMRGDARIAAESYLAGQVALVVEESGWEGFLKRAREGTAPFNVGRPELMAEGAKQTEDPAMHKAIVEAMFELARTKQTRGGMGDDYEKGDFGHALAELSMQQCDLASFDRAVKLTSHENTLRYAFWRKRITGGASDLVARIKSEADASDTRHVRQALEGIAPLLALGYCKA